MDKIQIQADVSRRIRLLRRIERTLEGPTFTDSASEERVRHYIDALDPDGLEQYLYSTMSQDLEILSIRQLRSKAKTYSILYYTLLNRIELIKAIHEARRRNEERNSGSGSAGDTLRPCDYQNDGQASTSGNRFP